MPAVAWRLRACLFTCRVSIWVVLNEVEGREFTNAASAGTLLLCATAAPWSADSEQGLPISGLRMPSAVLANTAGVNRADAIVLENKGSALNVKHKLSFLLLFFVYFFEINISAFKLLRLSNGSAARFFTPAVLKKNGLFWNLSEAVGSGQRKILNAHGLRKSSKLSGFLAEIVSVQVRPSDS